MLRREDLVSSWAFPNSNLCSGVSIQNCFIWVIVNLCCFVFWYIWGFVPAVNVMLLHREFVWVFSAALHSNRHSLITLSWLSEVDYHIDLFTQSTGHPDSLLGNGLYRLWLFRFFFVFFCAASIHVTRLSTTGSQIQVFRNIVLKMCILWNNVLLLKLSFLCLFVSRWLSDNE